MFVSVGRTRSDVSLRFPVKISEIALGQDHLHALQVPPHGGPCSQGVMRRQSSIDRLVFRQGSSLIRHMASMLA